MGGLLLTTSRIRSLIVFGLCVGALACRRTSLKSRGDAGQDAPRADGTSGDVPGEGSAGSDAVDGGEPEVGQSDALDGAGAGDATIDAADGGTTDARVD